MGSALEAQVLLALAHQTAGDTDKALATVEDALVRAEDERFVRIFLDAGPPMAELLEAAVRHGRAAPQASALLTAATVATPAGPKASQGLVDELSKRELDGPAPPPKRADRARDRR